MAELPEDVYDVTAEVTVTLKSRVRAANNAEAFRVAQKLGMPELEVSSLGNDWWGIDAVGNPCFIVVETKS